VADHNTGPLRVEDLVNSPGLRLDVLAGNSGLNRQVSWAHVSELEDPTPWLAGSEVIMTTGLAVPKSARQQVAYLTRLDAVGVSALLLTEGLHVPPLHPSFLTAADRLGLPVLRAPLAVPFIAVSQEVAAAARGDVRQRLQLQVFGALWWIASGEVSPPEVFRRLPRLSAIFSTPARRPAVPLWKASPYLRHR
jgi:purine catabolism regulator